MSGGKLGSRSQTKLDAKTISLHANTVAICSLIVSAFSLVVSFLTFYFSSLVRTDDLRVAVDDSPSFTFDREEGALMLLGHYRFVFMNAGNRPAAFFRFTPYVMIGQADCNGGGRYDQFATDFESFVLQPNEVATKTVQPRPSFGKQKTFIPLNKQEIEGGKVDVLLCHSSVIVTPSNAQARHVLQISKNTIDTKSEWDSYGYVEMYPDRKIPPIQVYYHSGNIFTD